MKNSVLFVIGAMLLLSATRSEAWLMGGGGFHPSRGHLMMPMAGLFPQMWSPFGDWMFRPSRSIRSDLAHATAFLDPLWTLHPRHWHQRQPQQRAEANMLAPDVNILHTPEEIAIHVDVGGQDPDKVSVRILEGGQLVLSGEWPSQKNQRCDKGCANRRWERGFQLDSGSVEKDGISAQIENGRLDVRIPKRMEIPTEAAGRQLDRREPVSVPVIDESTSKTPHIASSAIEVTEVVEVDV